MGTHISRFPSYSHKTSSQKDDRIDNSHDPFSSRCSNQAKFLREGQVGTVRSRLIPSLGSGSDGAQSDRVPEHEGAVPFVIALIYEGGALILRELSNHLEALGVPRDQSGATKQICVLRHLVRLGESSGIENSLLWRAAL